MHDNHQIAYHQILDKAYLQILQLFPKFFQIAILNSHCFRCANIEHLSIASKEKAFFFIIFIYVSQSPFYKQTNHEHFVFYSQPFSIFPPKPSTRHDFVCQSMPLSCIKSTLVWFFSNNFWRIIRFFVPLHAKILK